MELNRWVWSLICSCSCRRTNLVGSFEDTDGGVEGASPVVLGTGVFGYAYPAVALIVGLTRAADLRPLCGTLGVYVTVPRRANA